ncbi:MAG TPA: PQQ-binding-like beta-propeller repeat protein [Acidimicrobiales bacterium]|nr:PQQ-binding-like beta-propeller repeat protein [Acidimicrobiales bacterium]
MTKRSQGKGLGRLGVACAGAALFLATAGWATASAAGSPSRTKPASSVLVPAARRQPSPLLGDLTTYHYGIARSGEDTVDPRIAGLSSSPSWDDSLDGGVYAEPLVYDARVYVATENDSIYALSATTGRVIWRVHVGTAVSTSVIDTAPTLGGGCGDISPLGITGTPVIDTATNEIFAAEETEVGGNKWRDIRHWLVAVSLTTHRELWHRDFDPPDGNQGSHYYIPAEQQRPALTLFDGRVYGEYGGLDGDCGQYHGYVVGLPASGTGPLVSYQVPTQREGGIWGTSGAFVSPAGNLYVATGNGSSNTIADYDEGNSVIELSPTLQRLGYWAPGNWVQLNDDDWDLGSGGPIAVPGTSLLFAAGKPAGNSSFGYLMEDSPLGHIGKGAFTATLCTGGTGVYGADASDVVGSGAKARIYIYAPCGSGTEAVEIDVAARKFKRVWSGEPNGSPIVAGGLVWALNWSGGGLYGMSPTTGKVLIQRSTDGDEHFVTPAVGDGMMLVPTQNGVEAWRTKT